MKQITFPDMTLNVNCNRICKVNLSIDSVVDIQFKNPDLYTSPVFNITPYSNADLYGTLDPYTIPYIAPYLKSLINSILHVNSDRHDMTIYYTSVGYYTKDVLENIKHWYHLYSTAINKYSELTNTSPVSILFMSITELNCRNLAKIVDWLKELGFTCVHKIRHWGNGNSCLDIILTDARFNKNIEGNKLFFDFVESEVGRLI